MQCPWTEWLEQDQWLNAGQMLKVKAIADSAGTAAELSELLVKEGFITSFQALQLLSGSEAGLDCGRYRIRKRLGRGGMGEVFAAEPRDRRDVPVAIKTLQIDMNRPEADRKRLELRFLREMKAGREVRHPNVTRTVDFGRYGDRLFLVMPRLKGPSLSLLIESRKQNLEYRTILKIALHIVEGLKAIHDAGLVHRDLKPSNIVYDGYKRWMILDLGLAKALGDNQSLTRPGVILGTLDYASPEQLKDASKVTFATDFYSLGCILFHTATGRVPFEGGDAVSKIYRHRMTPAESLATIRPDLPPDFTNLVDKLLEKEPTARPDATKTLTILKSLRERKKAALGTEAGSVEVFTTISPESTSTSGEQTNIVEIITVPPEEITVQIDQLSDELFSNELSDEWSDPAPELDQRARYVQQSRSRSRSASRKIPGLAVGLKIGIVVILILSILFFFMSFRSFLDAVLA